MYFVTWDKKMKGKVMIFYYLTIYHYGMVRSDFWLILCSQFFCRATVSWFPRVHVAPVSPTHVSEVSRSEGHVHPHTLPCLWQWTNFIPVYTFTCSFFDIHKLARILFRTTFDHYDQVSALIIFGKIHFLVISENYYYYFFFMK